MDRVFAEIEWDDCGETVTEHGLLMNNKAYLCNGNVVDVNNKIRITKVEKGTPDWANLCQIAMLVG